MSSETLPPNDGDEQTSDERRRQPITAHQRPRPQRTAKTTRVDRWIGGLENLPGLVLTKLVTPAMANSMKGVYATLLQNERQSDSSSKQPRLDDASLEDAVQANPQLLNVLEPYLTDEQFERLWVVAHGGEEEQAGGQ